LIPTKISYRPLSLLSDIMVPNIIIVINEIRGRFRSIRYPFIFFRFARRIYAKKSTQIASLPSAGNCGYAHQKIPNQIIVTKR